MDKRDAAHLLEQIAAYLELKGENPFRIRAYQTASRAVSQLPGDLQHALASGELAELRGVGPGTLAVITEAMETGRASLLEELRSEVPPGLVEMLQISGLGVAKVRQIHESLGIETTAELEAAARDGRLARLPRFGTKTAAKILKGLEYLRRSTEFRLFHHARTEAENLARALRDLEGVRRVEIAGSIRRRRELIRDLDFVVVVDGPGPSLADRLAGLVGVSEFIGTAPGTFTLRFSGDTVADIYTTTDVRFGADLVRATGNVEHVHGLYARAHDLGLTWNDAGLTRDSTPVSTPDEESVYRLLGMQYVPPELREGTNEIGAAVEGTVPTLLEAADIRGFLHCHTNYSDGTSTIEDWARAGAAAGYDYIGITDHSGAAMYAGGLYAEAIAEQHAEIDAVNAREPGVRVLKGVEVDILEDGSLDYTPEIRTQFDFIIASVHNRFGHERDQMTARILRAMDDPSMAILGHPTGRLLLSRDPYPMDLDAILTKAAQCGIAIEINAHPQRLDLDWRTVRQAVDGGVMISIGADAHNVSGMSNMDLGLGIARKGWVTRDGVLNTRPAEAFLDFVRARGA